MSQCPYCLTHIEIEPVTPAEETTMPISIEAAAERDKTNRINDLAALKRCYNGVGFIDDLDVNALGVILGTVNQACLDVAKRFDIIEAFRPSSVGELGEDRSLCISDDTIEAIATTVVDWWLENHGLKTFNATVKVSFSGTITLNGIRAKDSEAADEIARAIAGDLNKGASFDAYMQSELTDEIETSIEIEDWDVDDIEEA